MVVGRVRAAKLRVGLEEAHVFVSRHSYAMTCQEVCAQRVYRGIETQGASRIAAWYSGMTLPFASMIMNQCCQGTASSSKIDTTSA